VQEIVSDFEGGIFKGVRQAFMGKPFLADPKRDEREKPRIKIFGCAFHWAQVNNKTLTSRSLCTIYYVLFTGSF